MELQGEIKEGLREEWRLRVHRSNQPKKVQRKPVFLRERTAFTKGWLPA